MSQTVIGFFDDAAEARKAVEKLAESGVSRDRIDVSRGGQGSGTNVSGGTSDNDRIVGDNPTADGGTVDDKGRNTNRFTDFFNNLFGGGSDDNDDAGRYSKVAQKSNTIVTVHAQSKDEAETAADILDDCGAVDVDERASQYGYADSRGQESGDRENISSENETVIPRVQENLEVGKRTEERGGVRVRSRIVERPVEEHVRLREEHVHVERESVNRPLTDGDMRGLEDREIEMRESAEVPVVNKEARVVEEIRVSKDVEERDETIRDTVRDTEIDVDNTGRTGNRSDSDDLRTDLDSEGTNRKTGDY